MHTAGSRRRRHGWSWEARVPFSDHRDQLAAGNDPALGSPKAAGSARAPVET